MTNKERLEIIKMDNERYHQEVVFSSQVLDDIKWLIKQAERAQWLEKELKHQTEHFSISFDLLEKQNKRYREALEEIRNRGTYELNNALKTDYGWIAHEALEGESNE